MKQPHKDRQPIGSRTVRRRVTALLSLTWLLIGLAPTAAHAVDQSNWKQGCAAGYACFWRDSIGSGPAASATNRDSNFTGDSYPGTSSVLGDNVKWLQNRMTSTGARPYSDPGYLGVVYSCVPKVTSPGAWTNNNAAYPKTNPAGLSSWKGC